MNYRQCKNGTEKRRKHNSNVVEIWYLICKQITSSSPPSFFFFFSLAQKPFFTSFFLLFDPTPCTLHSWKVQRTFTEAICQKLFKLWLECIYWFFFFFYLNDQRNEDFWKKLIWDSASGWAIQTLLNLWEYFIRHQVLIL